MASLLSELMAVAQDEPLRFGTAVLGWSLLAVILIRKFGRVRRDNRAYHSAMRRHAGIYDPWSPGYDLYIPSSNEWIIGGQDAY